MAKRTKFIGRPWLLAAGTVCALFLLVWAFGLFRSPKSPETVAREALGMVQAGDASGIFDSLSDIEIATLKLDEGKVQRFFEVFVNPRLAGFIAEGPPEVNKEASDGTVSLSQLFKNKDGRAFALIVQASPAGNEDAKVNAFVADTYLSLCNTDNPPGAAPPTGNAKREFWIEHARSLGEQLSAAGIPGFYTVGQEYYTWKSWIEHNEQMVASTQ